MFTILFLSHKLTRQCRWVGLELLIHDMTGCCQELFITRKRTSEVLFEVYAVQINIRIDTPRHVMVTPGTVLKLIPGCENSASTHQHEGEQHPRCSSQDFPKRFQGDTVTEGGKQRIFQTAGKEHENNEGSGSSALRRMRRQQVLLKKPSKNMLSSLNRPKSSKLFQ